MLLTCCINIILQNTKAKHNLQNTKAQNMVLEERPPPPPPHMIVKCFGCTTIHKKHYINASFIHTKEETYTSNRLNGLSLCLMKASIKYIHLNSTITTRGGRYGKNIISRFNHDSLSCWFYYFARCLSSSQTKFPIIKPFKVTNRTSKNKKEQQVFIIIIFCYIYIELFLVLKSLYIEGGNLLNHHQCPASTWMMRRQP